MGVGVLEVYLENVLAGFQFSSKFGNNLVLILTKDMWNYIENGSFSPEFWAPLMYLENCYTPV